MYLYHFGIRELPFTLTPNTQYFFGLPSHKKAIEVLTTAMNSGEGFIKVTGEVGTGKTLITLNSAMEETSKSSLRGSKNGSSKLEKASVLRC